jgi:hypothetical protein
MPGAAAHSPLATPRMTWAVALAWTAQAIEFAEDLMRQPNQALAPLIGFVLIVHGSEWHGGDDGVKRGLTDCDADHRPESPWSKALAATHQPQRTGLAAYRRQGACLVQP